MNNLLWRFYYWLSRISFLKFSFNFLTGSCKIFLSTTRKISFDVFLNVVWKKNSIIKLLFFQIPHKENFCLLFKIIYLSDGDSAQKGDSLWFIFRNYCSSVTHVWKEDLDQLWFQPNISTSCWLPWKMLWFEAIFEIFGRAAF